jgi:hypothetical protein
MGIVVWLLSLVTVELALPKMHMVSNLAVPTFIPSYLIMVMMERVLYSRARFVIFSVRRDFLNSYLCNDSQDYSTGALLLIS